MRLSLLALGALACGTAPPEVASSLQPARPGTDPPGVVIAGEAELRELLIDEDELDLGHPPAPALAGLLARGILNVQEGEEATCSNRPSVFNRHEQIACDPSLERCVVEDSAVYLFRRGRVGLWLFAIVYSDDPSGVESSPEVARALGARDEICALYDRVDARSLEAGPLGYVRAREDEEEGTTFERSCGAQAQADVRDDIEMLERSEWLTCSETQCWTQPASDQREPELFAERTEDGVVAIGFAEVPGALASDIASFLRGGERACP